MKKLITIIICASSICLCACNQKTYNEEYESLSVAYDELESECKKNLKECIYYNHLYTDLKAQVDNNLDDDISKANEELESINAEIEEMKGVREEQRGIYEEEIASLAQQILSLKEKIALSKNEPLTFSAGEYICGLDFPAGRYVIYGGSSNFFVKGGETHVNIILGDDSSWEVREYIHFFTEGEMIEARSPFKLKLID